MFGAQTSLAPTSTLCNPRRLLRPSLVLPPPTWATLGQTLKLPASVSSFLKWACDRQDCPHGWSQHRAWPSAGAQDSLPHLSPSSAIRGWASASPVCMLESQVLYVMCALRADTMLVRKDDKDDEAGDSFFLLPQHPQHSTVVSPRRAACLIDSVTGISMRREEGLAGCLSGGRGCGGHCHGSAKTGRGAGGPDSSLVTSLWSPSEPLEAKF